jgi:hypothetical protein
MARYDEAQADYGEFANIMGEIGTEISDEELEFKKDLDCRATAGDDSEHKRRDELMRAIDVSATSMHIMIQDKTRVTGSRLHPSASLPHDIPPTPTGGAKTALGQILTQNR